MAEQTFEEQDWIVDSEESDAVVEQGYTSYSDDLLSEEERQALLEDEYVPDTFKPVSGPVKKLAKGRFYEDSYQYPEVARDTYLRDFHTEMMATDYADYAPLKHKRFIHSDLTGSLNFYHKVLIQGLGIMLGYYAEGPLRIINGYRHPDEVGRNEHSAGLAVDIAADDWEHARKIMAAAYIAGLPTILPVGNIKKGEGHVHIDMAPPPNYTYDAGGYSGPWS